VSLIVGKDEPALSVESGSSRVNGAGNGSAKPWASFASLGGPHSDPAVEPVALEGERFRARYHLETVQVIRGRCPEVQGLGWGATILRREVSAARQPALGGLWLGAIDARASSSDDEVATLRRQWHGNPFRVALLLACAHTRGLLTIRPEERSYAHLGTPDAARLARVPALRRVVRQLHRGAAPGSGDWDAFAYFEMLPEHVAHVREYLAEQREVAQHQRLVEREAEVWLIKHLDRSEPLPPPIGA
jgi:hypothetical protein